MELSLYQARKLEATLRGLNVQGQLIDIRSYDLDIAQADIDAGIGALTCELDDKLYMNELRHDIKQSINETNMECGVSRILNERDRINEAKRILGGIAVVPDTTERQLESIQSYPADTRRVCVVRDTHIAEVEAELESLSIELRDLQTELVQLNNTVTITLESDAVEFLTEKGLLA